MRAKWANKKIELLTNDTEYEGKLLYLRRPNYTNIWEFKLKYLEWMCVTHKFDNVKINAQPTADYNATLGDFDGEVINLADISESGIIFLVETFGWARNFWFYIMYSKLFIRKFYDLKNSNLGKNWNCILKMIQNGIL